MRKTNVGYCADGNGEVFLKDRINIKELKNKLDNLFIITVLLGL